MTIHEDLNPILKILPKNEIFARADGFPDYKWKLKSQFDTTHEIFNELIEMIKKKLDGGKYLKKLESGVRKSEDDLDKEIIEEVNLNTYMSDDEMMSEVNFETSKSDFIIGGMRKLNK